MDLVEEMWVAATRLVVRSRPAGEPFRVGHPEDGAITFERLSSR
jgi:hypothetical protein